jgi:thioredoxin 2
MAVVTCPNCGAKNRVQEKGENVQPVCGKCRSPLPVSGPVEVTDASFQSVLQAAGNKPVLVDCWAAWCGPCRMIAPTIDQLARESGGKYVVAKLDVDSNPRVASQFQISSIPTMLLFKNGQLVDRIVGLQPKSALESRLARAA